MGRWRELRVLRRMPWRVAVYYWETGDKRVLPLMQALAKFFTGEKEARTLDSPNLSRAPWIASASVYLTSRCGVSWFPA